MKASEAVELMHWIARCFPRQKISPETLAVYAEMLVDLGREEVREAAKSYAATAEFFPSIAELRVRVAEARTGMPSPELAWVEVSRELARPAVAANQYCTTCHQNIWGCAHKPLPVKWSCPQVAEAVKALGGLGSLRASDAPEAARAHFFRIFSELRAQTMQRENVGSVLALTGSAQRAQLKAGP